MAEMETSGEKVAAYHTCIEQCEGSFPDGKDAGDRTECIKGCAGILKIKPVLPPNDFLFAALGLVLAAWGSVAVSSSSRPEETNLRSVRAQAC